MATYNKFEDFVEQMAKGVHQCHAAGHTFKAYLTNATPSASADTVLADLADLSTGGGYTAGGEDMQQDLSVSGGTVSMTAVDITWTGTSGGFGPFQYVAAYNDNPSSPADPLMAWWNYGSAISVAESETFMTDFGSSVWSLA